MDCDLGVAKSGFHDALLDKRLESRNCFALMSLFFIDDCLLGLHDLQLCAGGQGGEGGTLRVEAGLPAEA